MTTYPNHNPVEILDVPASGVMVGDYIIGWVIDGLLYLGKYPALRHVKQIGDPHPSGAIPIAIDEDSGCAMLLQPHHVYRVARGIR